MRTLIKIFLFCGEWLLHNDQRLLASFVPCGSKISPKLRNDVSECEVVRPLEVLWPVRRRHQDGAGGKQVEEIVAMTHPWGGYIGEKDNLSYVSHQRPKMK